MRQTALTIDQVLARASQAPAPAAPPKVDERIQRYIAACKRLTSDIRTWLEPARVAGAVEIDTTIGEKWISEQGFRYPVDALRLRIGKRIVDVEPRGTWVIGAYGRADVVSSPNEPAILTLDDAFNWEVPVVAGTKVRSKALDDVTFAGVLQRVLAV